MSEYPQIVCNHEGWEPTLRLVRRLSKLAKAKGFHSEYVCALALDDRAILLVSDWDDESTEIIAAKRNGEWLFVTEREYYELPPLRRRIRESW